MTPPAERCPTCDREGCGGPFRPACGDDKCDDCAERRDCESHAVDWRARALAAEPAAAQWAKVAPLIERLRMATSGAWDHEVVADIAVTLLAATEAAP